MVLYCRQLINILSKHKNKNKIACVMSLHVLFFNCRRLLISIKMDDDILDIDEVLTDSF